MGGRIENDGAIALGAFRCGNKAGLVDGELIVLGNKTFEWRASGSASAGRVQLDVKATDELTAAEFLAKVNANQPSIPVLAYADPVDAKTVRLQAGNGDPDVGLGERGNIAFTTTMSDPDNIIAASDDDTLSHGADAENKKLRSGSYLVTAVDEAAGSIMIPTGLQAPSNLQIDCWSATGLQKSLSTLFTFDGPRIKGEFDGATNPVEGDKINWSAW